MERPAGQIPPPAMDYADQLAAAGLYLEGECETPSVLGYVHCNSCAFVMEVSQEMTAAYVVQEHEVRSPECVFDEAETGDAGLGSQGAPDSVSDCWSFADINESTDDNGPGYGGDPSGSVVESTWSLDILEEKLAELVVPPECDSVAGRLDTLHVSNWPRVCSVQKMDVAQAGFFYNKEYQTFQCWSCGLALPCEELWKNTRLYPFSKHRLLAPSCIYLETLVSGSMFEVRNSSGTCVPDRYENSGLKSSENDRASTFSSYPSKKYGSVQSKSMAAAYFYYTGVEDVIRCAFCRLTLYATCVNDGSLLEEHFRCSPFCTVVAPNESMTNASRPSSRFSTSMEKEEIRFGTFENWPHHLASASVGELAADGFYYSGVGDQVTCFACQVSVRHCPSGRSASDRHSSQVPICPLLTGLDTSNVPLQAPAAAGVEMLRDYHARKQTFATWPKHIPITSDELADAGLFYLGVGDIVQCAFCLLELRHWSKDDMAWSRHQRKSPNCKHVRQNCPRNISGYVQAFIRNPHKLTGSEVRRLAESGCLPESELAMESFIPPTPAPMTFSDVMTAPAQNTGLVGMGRAATRRVGNALVAAPEGARRQMQRFPISMSPGQQAAPRNQLIGAPQQLQQHQTGNAAPRVQGQFPGNGYRPQLPWAPAAQRSRSTRPKQVKVCVGCSGTTVSYFLLPCTHLSCSDCAHTVDNCPDCRNPVLSRIRMLKL